MIIKTIGYNGVPMKKNPQKRRYPSIAAGNQGWLENLQPQEREMIVDFETWIGKCSTQESLQYFMRKKKNQGFFTGFRDWFSMKIPWMWLFDDDNDILKWITSGMPKQLLIPLVQ